MTRNPDKIVQIIPAPQHWKSVNFTSDKEKVLLPIVCIALTSAGEVVLMDMDDSGYIEMMTSNNVIYNKSESEG